MLKLAGELLEGQLADHIACLDAHTKNSHEAFRTGEYVLPFLLSVYRITYEAMTADKLYAVPFLVARNMTVDRIAINIAVPGAAGKKARLGIYNDGTNLYPGSLLLDAGEVAADSGGTKAITINQSLMKGIYWLVVVSNGTPQPRMADYSYTPLGLNINLTAFQTGWSVAFTYDALPDPFTAGASMVTTSSRYIVGLRLASLD